MAKTLHQAYKVAAEIYDEPRDLEAYELALLTAIRTADADRSMVVGTAVRMYGDLTPAYYSTVFLADRSRDDALDCALAVYRAEHERIDQGYEDEVESVRHMIAAE